MKLYRAHRAVIRTGNSRFFLRSIGNANTLKPLCKSRVNSVKLFQTFRRINENNAHACFVSGHKLI